ncbi:MAG: exodeoxyribonuclease III [Deltaproteobacteria bacterium]|jgi:exodeoxyribonuclease-3|nr:exodeoxyribonuclease III [Deltaproteobacteria bacterium]
MILYSWNVNGLRAIAKKPGFMDFFNRPDVDLLGLQEIRATPDQLSPELAEPPGRLAYFVNHKAKGGYSGVAVYSRGKPLKVVRELPDPKFAQEGRLVHLELAKFHFLSVYFPNGQKDEERLRYKLGYYEAFLTYCQKIRQTKPVVACGDFNAAHRPLDLAEPEANEGVSGFLPEERAFLDRLIAAGYVDVFRALNGDLAGQYSWWSYRSGDRRRNVGWRIDYFFASEELRPNLARAWLEPTTVGSDHCPVGLELSF